MARKPISSTQQTSASAQQPILQPVVFVSIPEFERFLEGIIRRVLQETSDNRIPNDDLLKVNEAAKLFRCHPSTIERWARQGEIPSVTRGRLKFYSRAQLLKYLEDTDTNPTDSQSSN